MDKMPGSANRPAPQKRKNEVKEEIDLAAIKVKKLDESVSEDHANSDAEDSGSESEADLEDENDLSGENILPSSLPVKLQPAEDQPPIDQPPPLPPPPADLPVPSHQQQIPRELHLQEGNVYRELESAFSNEIPPSKITYRGSSFNLTEAFDKFWSVSYKQHFNGHLIKLPKPHLSNNFLKTIAKVLRRGWEDQHYFPEQIAQPLLETCIFNREDVNLVKVSEQMFLDYIEPSERELVERSIDSLVNPNILSVFERYCPGMNTSSTNSVRSGCIEAVRKMIANMQTIINIWTRELVGLMDLEEFTFLMEFRNRRRSHKNAEEHDLDHHVAPHKLWHTFFFGFDDHKIHYYFRLLENDKLSTKCHRYNCRDSPFLAKHLLSKCDVGVQLLMKDRHDSVLKILERELTRAIERRSVFFSEGQDWKTIIMYGNYRWNWPPELSMIGLTNMRPHIIAYSMTPKKRVLVIEHSISWEHWIEEQRVGEINKYNEVKRILEEFGFEVKLEVIVMGSRGVVTQELYNILERVFGMNHSNISRVMEEISKKIVSVPYGEYTELMGKIREKRV